jgi:hypothetical protein
MWCGAQGPGFQPFTRSLFDTRGIQSRRAGTMITLYDLIAIAAIAAMIVAAAAWWDVELD